MNNIIMNKMGMDFNKDDKLNDISDLGNYRFFIYDLVLKNDKVITLEVMNRARYNEKNKCIGMEKLYIQTYWTSEDGSNRTLLKINELINKMEYSYTKKDLLKAVNLISKCKFDELIIL